MMAGSMDFRVATPRAALTTILVFSLALVTASTLIAGPAGPVPSEQTEPWRVVSYLEDANLEGRGIFHFDFETDGTVWVAASDGLYRYDGYHWDRFTSAHGLPSDYVRSVRVTRDGTLWVGTNRGAGTFDGERFDSGGSEAHLPGPSVRRITEDPDGTLWFACDQWPPSKVSAGLARLRQGEWETWNSADGLPSNYVSDLFTSSSGEHFILTRAGLAQFDGDRIRRPIEEAGIDACRDYIWSMVEGPDGQLLATTRQWVCVRENGRWKRFPNGPPSSGIGELVVTRDGAILACSMERAARFSQWKNDRFVPLWSTELDTRGSVQYLREAPDGSIWIVGVNLLARWERRGGEWQTFHDLPRPSLRDGTGGLWFAGHDRVERFAQDRWTRIPEAAGPLLRDPSGGVWMRTRSGLAHWRAGELSRFDRSEIGIAEIISANIDGAGHLWVVGTGSRGLLTLARFDGKAWSSYAFVDLKPTEKIVLAIPDVRAGVWFVAEELETGFYRVLRVNGTVVADFPIPEVARRYWIPRLHMDSGGTLWIFGMLGAQRFDPDDPEAGWQEILDLPGRQLRAIVSRGPEVWFSYLGSTGGRGGVSRLANGSWRHFSSAAQELTSSDGGDLLFFGDTRGIQIITGENLAALRLLTLPEPATISTVVAGPDGDFWLGDSRRTIHYLPDGIPPDTVLGQQEQTIVEGHGLVLQVGGVERFVPRDQSRPLDVAIRLDDRPWGEFEPLLDETITITGLGVGDHVVHARLRDQGLDIDPTPAALQFRVYPIPLQERSWFRAAALGIFMTVLFLALLSVVSRQREIHQRRKRRELERELLQISEREQRRIGRDLHDGLGQRLTGISYQCEALRGMILRDADGTPQQTDEIGASVREAISETRALAHALYPPEIDQGNLDIAIRRLVETTDRGFEGSCIFQHRWSPDALSRKKALNIYRLTQEALSNAVRHAQATKIEVVSRQDDRTWIVEVSDNGRGFDALKPSSPGLGLQIMRYRANLIGGRLEVTSRRGKGTKVRCSLRMTGD
jgi:signal transduction histidine kinase/ligand-binding sensor domain-containing protein